MNRKLALAITLAIFLLCTLGSENVFAQRTVGVNPGDWWQMGWFYSGIFDELLPPEDKLVWTRFNITAFEDDIIYFEQVARYEDDSEQTSNYQSNPITGEEEYPGVVVAANLSEGDRVYTSDSSFFGNITIRETIYKNYLGQNVEVNHVNFTTSPRPFDGDGEAIDSYDFYWYRETGMLAEYSLNMTVQYTNGTSTWGKAEAIIIAVVPEFPSFLILPLFMIATFTATVYVKKRKRG